MGSRSLPDFSALNARLQELYGASLEASVSRFGGYQVLEISIRALDNRYCFSGEDLTSSCARLLADIWLDPKLDSRGLFDEKNTALQRRFIQDTIDAEINDKRLYAVSQCLKYMCEGEPVAVRAYGYPDTAAAITPASVTAAWENMLLKAPVEIVLTGAADGAPAKKIFEEAFNGRKRDPAPYSPVSLRPSADRVKEKTETMELSQAKLVLGMRCGKIATRKERNAARMFAALYGGTPFSKLFLNVREKLSLCYYCASRFDSSTGLMLVDSGVEAANRQKAQDEILAQLKSVASGNVSEEELSQTKMLLSNSIRTMTDSPAALEGWYMAQILRGDNIYTPDEDIRGLCEVTSEEVVAAAGKVTLDTVYFLAGREAGK
jgi:predicted Zn-dependent peptidase